MVQISRSKKSKGVVYILTNPSMPGWIKVGSTDKNNMKERLSNLNRHTIVPLSFQIYAEYKVNNSLDIEKKIHAFIDEYLPDTRAIETTETGKKRKREFYQLNEKDVYKVFEHIAALRGDLNCLKRKIPTETEKKETNKKSSKLILKNIGIPDQAKLYFTRVPSIFCYADIKENKLIYEGKSYAISNLAKKLLNEKCGCRVTTISGSFFFTYKGKKLGEIRREKINL